MEIPEMPLMLIFWRLLKRLLKLALAWAVEVELAVTTATPDGRVTPEGIETPEGREMVTSWAETKVAMVARTAAKVHFILAVLQVLSENSFRRLKVVGIVEFEASAVRGSERGCERRGLMGGMESWAPGIY
jgi:hypothetical protein